jgi:RimJ/RimL family protein N-acetyltransferase
MAAAIDDFPDRGSPFSTITVPFATALFYRNARLIGVSPLPTMTDGVITLRPSTPADEPALVAGRDALFHQFLGPGVPGPDPVACIWLGDRIVGWADFDHPRAWLVDGEVNLGYNVFADVRGRGYASRAVQLLLHHLAQRTHHHTATLLIDPDNAASLALATRLRFKPAGEVDGQQLFKRPAPSATPSDGEVTLRPMRADDIEMDLAAKDDEQIDWLWLPGQRESWASMTLAEQRAHALAGIVERATAFGAGPKWTFAVDTAAVGYVAHVDSDLANEHVPWGEANISYSAHPDHRRHGYVARGVRLLCGFLRDNTGAREAHIIVDERNEASRAVAAGVGADAAEQWVNEHGATKIRHVIDLLAWPQ